jgi:uncharacterized membrane protein
MDEIDARTCEKCEKVFSTISACEKHELNCNEEDLEKTDEEITCSVCSKKIKWYKSSKKIRNKIYCKECYRTDTKEGQIIAIKKEIKDLEESGGGAWVFVILGIIGLFFYLVPGIIFFVIAGLISSSRKSKAASLRAQLLLFDKKEKRMPSKKEPLDILKNRFASGDISEAEFLRKKKLLKD